MSMSLSWRKDSSGLVFLWGGYMYTVHVSTFEIVVGISELEKRLQWISFVYKNRVHGVIFVMFQKGY